MTYEKPKVFIELEEYNELLAIRDKKKNEDLEIKYQKAAGILLHTLSKYSRNSFEDAFNILKVGVGIKNMEYHPNDFNMMREDAIPKLIIKE